MLYFCGEVLGGKEVVVVQCLENEDMDKDGFVVFGEGNVVEEANGQLLCWGGVGHALKMNKTFIVAKGYE